MLRVGAGGEGPRPFIHSFIHSRSTHGYLLWDAKPYACASQVLCPLTWLLYLIMLSEWTLSSPFFPGGLALSR